MKKPDRLPKILSPPESKAFRSVIRNPRDEGAISLMHDAGLRVSGAANLKLQNIDWNRMCIRFITKGGREAEIPISNRLRDSLEKLFRARPPQATHDFLLWDLKNPSKGIGRFALWKVVKKYANKTGILRSVSPHMLRHTFATELYRATRNLKLVQKLLVHKKEETTSIYVHLVDGDQQKSLELIDRRPWLVKLFSRLKTNIVPDLLKPPKPEPFYIGELIGRESQMAALRKAYSDRRNAILVGEEGVGKKTLLKTIYNEKKEQGEPIYQLEEFRPSRAAVVELCEQLQADGLIEGELPKDRTDKSFIGIVRKVAKEKPLTLIIHSLNDVTKNEIRALRKLSQNGDCIIFSSITPDHKSKLNQIFFSNYQEIPVGNFSKSVAVRFARKALADVNLPDKTAYINYIYHESGGNPRAMAELIQATRKTGELEPEHRGREKVLPAVYLLTVIWTAVVMSRYPASSLSQPQWKVWATIIVFGLLPFIVLDRLLKMRRR